MSGQGQAQEQVQVQGDTLSYEEQGEMVTAEGNVVVTKGQTTLTADTVAVSRTTSELTARGRVVLTDPQGDVRAEAMHLELIDETDNTPSDFGEPIVGQTTTGLSVQNNYTAAWSLQQTGNVQQRRFAGTGRPY